VTRRWRPLAVGEETIFRIRLHLSPGRWRPLSGGKRTKIWNPWRWTGLTLGSLHAPTSFSLSRHLSPRTGAAYSLLLAVSGSSPSVLPSRALIGFLDSGISCRLVKFVDVESPSPALLRDWLCPDPSLHGCLYTCLHVPCSAARDA